MNVGKPINACAPDICSMSTSFTKRDKNPNILMGSLRSKVCCFIVNAKLQSCTRTSEVSATGRILEVIFNRYDPYDINLSKSLFVGLIVRRPTWDGPTGFE